MAVMTTDMEAVDGTALLDPAAIEAAIEAEREAAALRTAKLKALVQKLAAKRDESVRAKRDIDERMANSLRQYYGYTRLDEPTKQFPGPQMSQRTPKPHLTRARTDRWEARMVDMVSNNPWALEPEGETSQASADGMEKAIKDQLNWCKYDKSLRRTCRDAARIGTGLVMGPMKTVRSKRRYVAQSQMPGIQMAGMVVEESIVPEMRCGDLFHFFPEMVESIDKASYAHYLFLMGKTEVSNLKPGFDEEQINGLLNTDPEIGEVGINIQTRNTFLNRYETLKDRYAVWRFTGVLEKDDLEVLGLCDCSEVDELGNALAPPMAMADIWYSQEFVLRARLMPIPDDFRVPYYLFAPFPIDDSMFGMSLPELAEDSQRVIDSSWMCALHNASVSSGPMVVMRAGMLKPTDDQYQIRGPKVFNLTDQSVDMEQAIKVINIPNTVDQALMIFDKAVSIMDEELNTAQWASGETASETNTASGLAMIMNVRSILQQKVACAADDGIIEPTITRMVWWNNEHGTDEAIKGDYCVNPSVQSERLVKDVQAQQTQAFTMMSADPRFAPYIDNYEVLKGNAALVDAPVEKFIKPRDQVEQEMQQNPPPNVEAEQAAYLRARAETEAAKARTEEIKAQKELLLIQKEMQPLPAANDDLSNAASAIEFQQRERELDLKAEDIEARKEIARMREESARLNIAARMKETELKTRELAASKAEKSKADLMREGLKTEQIAQEIAIKQRTGTGI